VSRERRESLREEECLKPKLKNCNRVTTEFALMCSVFIYLDLKIYSDSFSSCVSRNTVNCYTTVGEIVQQIHNKSNGVGGLRSTNV